MEVIIKESYAEVSQAAAHEVARVIEEKPSAVLGLATGSTPLGLYTELIRRYEQRKLDFSSVTTFNLDEYVGLPATHPQSYHFFMRQNLFDHINVAPENIHLPAGMPSDCRAFCREYEQEIASSGGIDLQILGIGSDGHIAFNEPGSSLASRTRVKTLARPTIEDNSRFFDRPEQVPEFAITMGVGTILEARKIILLATGENKAGPIAQAIEGPITSMCSASALQMHEHVLMIVDRAAASQLEQVAYYEWVQKKRSDAPPTA